MGFLNLKCQNKVQPPIKAKTYFCDILISIEMGSLGTPVKIVCLPRVQQERKDKYTAQVWGKEEEEMNRTIFHPRRGGRRPFLPL